MAAQNGHTAVVEILLKAGADVNKVSDVGCGEVLTRRVNPNTLYSLSCINAKCQLNISSTCLVHAMYLVHAGWIGLKFNTFYVEWFSGLKVVMGSFDCISFCHLLQ